MVQSRPRPRTAHAAECTLRSPQHFPAATFQAFARDTRGATAIEYALIAALIAVVIIGAVTAMASNLGAMFDTVSSAVT